MNCYREKQDPMIWDHGLSDWVEVSSNPYSNPQSLFICATKTYVLAACHVATTIAASDNNFSVLVSLYFAVMVYPGKSNLSMRRFIQDCSSSIVLQQGDYSWGGEI